jgi:hypothetical protein
VSIGRDGLAALEGRQVSVALEDGSRIDDCQLVSGPRADLDGLWLYTEGHDTIVPLDTVTEVWEAPDH